ncbi:ABC transporter substrate-binding protein [Deinococcus lacus]|uniref:ABC transporter substrate-binding protein n=2 Tax=Deinococcus lacus TaxID=392561 RepID=A0ABW1YF26_9DEIO
MTPFTTPDWPYLMLRAALLARDGEQEGYAVSLGDLEAWWGKSGKTVKRTLGRLQREGKLVYLPGRGRGNRSRLTFTAEVRGELATLTAALAHQQAAGELARLSRLPFPKGWILTPEVQQLFGLSASPAGVDRLRTVVFRDYTSLDPLTAFATTEAHLLMQVFDPLTRFDPATERLEAHLAHHWEVSEDGLRWTFYLRKGAAFHHGRVLDAGDVVYTLERLRRGAGWFLPDLVRVSSDHPYRVQLDLARPDAFLPRRLADTHALILPKDAPLRGDHLIGTGAFRWQAIPGGVRLSAHDHHFAGRPLIDEVELYRVEPLSEEPGLHVAGAQAQTVTDWQTEVGVHFLIWNAGQPATQNANLRAALRELHDIHRFWEETRPPWPLLTAQSFYPRRSAQREPYLHSDKRARALLAEAGPLPPLRLWVLNRPDAVPEAQWLARRAAEFGLQVDIHRYELHDDISRSTPADLTMMGEVSGPDEQLSFWTAMKQPELFFGGSFLKMCWPR